MMWLSSEEETSDNLDNDDDHDDDENNRKSGLANYQLSINNLLPVSLL